MALVNLLLNLAALLLWVSWRALGFPTVATPGVVRLSGVLKGTRPAGSGRSSLMWALLAVLVVRALFYWRLGSEVGWVPWLDLGVVTLPFNSLSLGRMMLYSLLSFVLVWTAFYLCLLLLSLVNSPVPDSDPVQRWVRQHLGWVEHWPASLKLIVPWLAIAGVWYAANPGLIQLGLAAPPKSPTHLWEQGLVLGLGTLVVWKLLIVCLLLVHVINSYLYLGHHSFWTFVNLTSRRLLQPLRWLPLRWGRIDFGPLLAVALVLGLGELGERGLRLLFGRLPL